MDSLVERLGEDHFDDRDGCRVRKGFDELCHERRKAAARITALESDNARLREALVSEREENLWNAYSTGNVRDGQWDHLCMSEGEWLAGQCGFDPKTRRYSAQAIRDAIPIAARQALADMEQADVD